MTDLAYTISSSSGKVLELLTDRNTARGYVNRHADQFSVPREQVRLAALRAGETMHLRGVSIAAVQPTEPDHEPFTHTGVLMVRIHAETTAHARELLAAAASAALEAAPGIAAIESTSVTRNPAPRRTA